MGDPVTNTILATSTVGQIGLSVKQHQAQKRALRAQRAIETKQEQRAQLAQLRQQQIQQSRMVVAGAQTGTLDSSGFRGGVSSVGSTVAGNIGFANQLTSLRQSINRNVDEINRLGLYKQIGSQIQSAALQTTSVGHGGGATPPAGSVNQSVNNSFMRAMNKAGG